MYRCARFPPSAPQPFLILCTPDMFPTDSRQNLGQVSEKGLPKPNSALNLSAQQQQRGDCTWTSQAEAEERTTGVLNLVY